MTTETTDTPPQTDAVGAQVQRGVRPLVERLEAAAHAWENSLTICGDHMPSPAMLREAKAEIERLRRFAVHAAGLFASVSDTEETKNAVDALRRFSAEALRPNARANGLP